MIKDVSVKLLTVHNDERGRLMEILRNDDEIFTKFGQVYMTTNYQGVIKAWHCHKMQIDYVSCVKGMIKLVLFDKRENSPTNGEINEYFIGDSSNRLIVIPPGVYHGWKNIKNEESIVISVINNLYNRDNPDEMRLPYNTKEIPYNWDIEYK